MKHCLILILLFGGYGTFGQTSAVRSSTAECINDLLSLGKTNILDIGYPPNATISLAHGTLTKISSHLFQVAPYTTEGRDTLFIKKGNKTIFSRVFYIVPAEKIKEYKAVPIWGSIIADTATAEALASNLLLIHLNPDNGLYTLDSLCIFILHKRGEFIGPFCSNSIVPTNEQINMLKKTGGNGTKVYAEFIGTSLENRRTRFVVYKRLVPSRN